MRSNNSKRQIKAAQHKFFSINLLKLHFDFSHKAKIYVQRSEGLLNFSLADDEIFELSRGRLVPRSFHASPRAVVCAFVYGIVGAVIGLVLDVKRLDSLAGLFKQVRIEGKDAFEHFFWPVLFVGVNCCEAAAGVADDDRVAEEDLVLGRDVVENRGDGG